MKNKIIKSIILLSLGIAIYQLWNKSSKTLKTGSTQEKVEKQVPPPQLPSESTSQDDEPEFDYMSVLSEREQEHVKSTGHVFTKEEVEKLKRKKLGKDIQSLFSTLEELKTMMDTPVEFYGQVLDQFDQPVVGAKILYSWTFMGPQHSAKELKSDAYGKFEIVDMKAHSIHVSIYPPVGYNEQVRVSRAIQIAKAPERILTNENYKKFSPELKLELEGKLGREEAYKGDKTRPVIFRLKKL